MAYINGKEILFSPNINITVGENYVLSDEDIEKIAQALIDSLVIEQEVTDSDNLITARAVFNEFTEFGNAYDKIIENAVITQKEFDNGDVLHLEHNKDYHATEDITDLNIHIGTGISSVMFKIADSGDFNIEIIGCSGYIGKAPDFKNGETWELNIHNGIIAAGKVVSE